jgi:uncharacterized membrane protein
MAHNELLLPPKTKVNISNRERIASAAAGAFLLVRGILQIDKKPFTSVASIAAGSILVLRGTSGHCMIREKIGRNTAYTSEHHSALEIRETLIVDKPRQQVYSYWRMLEHLPVFMKHLKQVKEKDSLHSHWEAGMPGIPFSLHWDATIIEELANESLAWRSDEGAMVENAGQVVFKTLPNGSTEIQAFIVYRPPAGETGRLIASALNRTFEKLLREDLQRFRLMVESQELTLSNPESHAPLE